MESISYDVVFLRAILGAVYPCAWPLAAGAIGLAVAGGNGQKIARNRLLAFAAGFLVAFVLLHLYGTPVSNWLQRHRMVGELAVSFVLMFEGLFLLGVQNVWARLRGRSPGEDPVSDATTSALLGLGMPFAVNLCLIAPSLSAASALGDAGQVLAGGLVVLVAGIGTALMLLGLGHLAYLLVRRLGPSRSPSLVAGAGFVLLSILIVLGLA